VAYAGLDVGSRTIKLVMLDGGMGEALVVPTGANPLQRCRELMATRPRERLYVTGYGRHLVAPALQGQAVTEIRAFAVGARHLYPDCHTVIDIGGQDCKVIRLADNGEVQKFEMNDRCAAGTGKFLEVMAGTLEVGIADLGPAALAAARTVRINSLCTVFAESEVVSLIARGEEVSAIALGVHETITARVATMTARVGVRGRLVLAGGAARNVCLVKLLGEKTGLEPTVPLDPQTTGALGAALLAEGDC